VRSIGVAVSGETATLQQVQDEFKDVRINNWICAPNVHLLRECVTFVPLMETLPQTENDITFYGHAKGVRHKNGGIPTIWAHVMYRLMLEFPERVEQALQTFKMTGAFKRYSEFKLPKHHCWHYSGTFYWFRNKDVFVDHANDWRDLHPRFFAGVEAWPSRVFAANETHCMFNENHGETPYDWFTWQRMLPSLKEEFGIVIDIGPQPVPMWKPANKV